MVPTPSRWSRCAPNIPRSLRALDRAVTLQDYADLAIQVPGVPRRRPVRSSTPTSRWRSSGSTTRRSPTTTLTVADQTFIDARKMIGTTVTIVGPTYKFVTSRRRSSSTRCTCAAAVKADVEKVIADDYGFSNVDFGFTSRSADLFADLHDVPAWPPARSPCYLQGERYAQPEHHAGLQRVPQARHDRRHGDRRHRLMAERRSLATRRPAGCRRCARTSPATSTSTGPSASGLRSPVRRCASCTTLEFVDPGPAGRSRRQQRFCGWDGPGPMSGHDHRRRRRYEPAQHHVTGPVDRSAAPTLADPRPHHEHGLVARPARRRQRPVRPTGTASNSTATSTRWPGRRSARRTGSNAGCDGARRVGARHIGNSPATTASMTGQVYAFYEIVNGVRTPWFTDTDIPSAGQHSSSRRAADRRG